MGARRNRPARPARGAASKCLLAALALLIVAACGGGTPSDPTPSPAGPALRPTATALPPPTATAVVPLVLATTLEEANLLLRAGEYDDAAAGFANVAASSDEPAIISRARLGEAIAVYGKGDTGGSVQLLRLAVDAAAPGSPEQTRAAYLLGVRLNESGAFAEAAGVLGPHTVAPAGSPLDPYIATEYARALASSDETAAAAETWDALLADPTTGDHLRATILRGRADLAREAGDLAAAAASLTELADLTGDQRVRYELAGLAFILGDIDTFGAQLRRIVTDRPSTLEAVLAIGDLRTAGFAVDPGQEGYVLYRHRAYAEARTVLFVAAAEPGLAEADLAFRTYYLAASHDDAGFYEEAVPLYDSVASLEGAGVYGHRAQYWAARSLEGAGDTAGAALRYDALYRAVPAGEFTDEAGFRAGFVRLRSGDAAGAVAAWSVLPAAEARTLYWLGRAQQTLGDAPSATVSFQAAAAIDPRSFYGVEASRALGAAVTTDGRYRPLISQPPPDWAAIEAWLAGLVPGARSQLSAPEVVELAAVGLSGPAADVIDLALARTDDPSELLALARIAYDAALPNQVTTIAFRLQLRLGIVTSQLPEVVAVLRYPLDYVVLLEEGGRQYGVDPLLIAALVLQESLWDAGAVSIAGALGLTQVIPATAASVASALGQPDFDVGDLFRPAVSLEFGAFYIGGQLDRFGDVHHALAAYNGGPENAERWAGVAASPPADFVEAVEFPETESYVELVMSHYAWYQFLYR